MKNEIQNLLDQGLMFMSQDQNKSFVARGLELYVSPFGDKTVGDDQTKDFTTWFLHDYRYKGQSIFTLNEINSPVLTCVERSLVSIFKVNFESKNMIFKDIITNKDYKIMSDQSFDDGDLIKIRIYPIEDYYILLDEPLYFDTEYEKTIRKSIMYQYNSYCSVHGPIAIDDFIKNQSHMVYHLMTLIEYYEEILQDDENLHVYVAKYKIEDKDNILDLILDSDDFQLIEHNKYETLIHHLSDEGILAELLVTSQWLEIECVSESILSLTQSVVESIIKDEATFISVDHLRLDDLIE
jgi:hypothetical protein